MNKRILIIVIGFLVIVGGSLYIVNQQSQNVEQTKMLEEKDAMKAKEDAVMEEKNAVEKSGDDKMMVNKNSTSRYVEYSKAAFNQVADMRRVLFFYASWCPICRPANADFEKNSSKIPEDMVLIRVNYNDPDTDQDEKDLAKKYGITYQHTFVQIDSQGKEITRWSGGQTDELLANIK